MGGKEGREETREERRGEEWKVRNPALSWYGTREWLIRLCESYYGHPRSKVKGRGAETRSLTRTHLN